jgi:N-acyl-D-aspartate/D-glutamate deacylase
MEFDTIIRGGTIVDGTRLPRFRGDVGIRDGRIARIGRLDQAKARRVLDAQGCIVAPGFVDLHTHYDAQIHWDPWCTISGWHGVTSVALGNCGIGFAPVKRAERERVMLMMTRTEQIPFETMQEGMTWTWESFPQWLDNLHNIPKGVNVLTYVPVTPLMVYVMGLEAARSRPATPAERAEMQRLLHEAMDAGACGFSLQRLGKNSLQTDYDGVPMPTDTMCDEDILCLARVLYERDEGIIQILQAEDGGDIAHSSPAIRKRDHEFLEELARVSGRPLLHNVIFVLDDMPNFHREELAWVHDCNAKGLRVYAQGSNLRSCFNFTLETWTLYDTSAAWVKATTGTNEHKRKMMADPAIREQMRAEHHLISGAGQQAMPEYCTVMAAPGFPELEQRYVGRLIGDIAADEDKHPADVMLDIALAGDLKVSFQSGCFTSTDASIVGPFMSDPYVMAGVSDGGAHTKFFTGGGYTTDFLTWLVRDSKQISVEEAHYHLSYLPAQAAGFADRGYLREGAPADIVVYNLDELKRTPDWAYEIVHDLPANEWRCIQRAEGYRYTLVNGEVTFENGQCTGATPGRLLRNRSATEEVLAAQPA